MAAPLASIAAKAAQKIACDVLTEPEKVMKWIIGAIAGFLIILLLIFVIPAMLIVSIPSLLFGSSDNHEKYIAMYQKAPIQIEAKNKEYIEDMKKQYADYDDVQVNYDYDLTWQKLMAIDTALFAQDFSKTSVKHINELGEMFITRNVTTREIKVTEKYTTTEHYTVDGEKKSRRVTKTRTVTKRIATINVTTKSFYEVLDLLNMDSFQKQVAKNVYDLLLSSYADGNTDGITDGISSEIPLFHQWDERWGSIPYGDHGTISSSGCGPTSAAMVITGLQGKMDGIDKNGDGIADPSETARYAVSHGHRVSEGTSWAFFEDIGHAAGLNVRQYSTSQYQKVLEELKQGHPVIASMGPGHFTSAGHFIVLVGVLDDGKIKVNDPNKQSCSDTPWDFESVIVAEAVQFWAFDNPNRKTIEFEATAYTGAPEEGGGQAANGTMLLGKDLRDKLIAVDTSIIPMGSRVLIKVPENKRYQTMPDGTVVDMNGYYTAVDTGNAIKGHIIDLYFGTGDEYKLLCENSWGRQKIQVYLKN